MHTKSQHLPNLNSPKLPQPIFLPTRKFGPTINIPEDELTECRAGYIPLEFFDVAPPPVPPAAAAVALLPVTVTLTPVAGAPLQIREKKEENNYENAITINSNEIYPRFQSSHM